MRSNGTYADFLKSLAAKQVASGYLFVGTEGFLVDEGVLALRDALLTDDFTNLAALPKEGGGRLVDDVLQSILRGEDSLIPAETEEQLAKLDDARRGAEAFDYAAYQGRETDADQVVLQTRTPPFTARRRLVIVRDFDKYRKADQEKLLAALAKESPVCRLVLTAGATDATLVRLIGSTKCGKFVVEIPPSGPEELNRMIESWATRNRFTVTEEARQLLYEVCGDSLAQLKSELEKMKTALGKELTANGSQPTAQRQTPDSVDRRITKDTIRDYTGHWREYEVSEFVDAVTKRNRALALSNLRRLIDWDEEPVKITGWLAGRFMRMLAYSYGDARLWNKTEIGRALHHLAKIDLRMKSGYPERYYLLESFVIRRTAAVKRK